MDQLELARHLTREMRQDDHPSWEALRQFLSEKALRVEDAAMADRFPESQGDFGVLVLRDGRAFTLTFSPGPGGDITTRTRGIHITRWMERVDADSRFAYQEAIDAGIGVLREEEAS